MIMISQGIIFTAPGFWILEYQLVIIVYLAFVTLLLQKLYQYLTGFHQLSTLLFLQETAKQI